MTEDEYNALAAARKYVWAALRRARNNQNQTSEILRAAERRIVEIAADLAKIDAVLDAEDRVGKAEAAGG